MPQTTDEAKLEMKCKKLARDVRFQPSMSKQIEDIVLKYGICKKSNVKEPLMCHGILNRSWAKLGGDLIHFDQSESLLCVPYYS